jgi:hypothetical protein
VSDLITWLRAQLDEDEQVASAASPGPWRSNAEHDEIHAVDGITVAEGFALSGRQLRATVDHIVRWDPARALAEVDAKRRILDLLAETLNGASEYFTVESCDEVDAILAERTMRLLALPYAERPGYREEWRP